MIYEDDGIYRVFISPDTVYETGIRNIYNWCTTNCNGHWSNNEDANTHREIFIFNKKEDALLFKLTYGEAE